MLMRLVDIRQSPIKEYNVMTKRDAVSQGFKRILIIANDTDVIVLGISFVSDIGADKLWVLFRIECKLRNISIHDIFYTNAKAQALPIIHSLT